ncbi:hypothetical protein AB0L71_25045 [Streptomyces sp. NPDC052052]|uniref:hypothetical protein n=1 Tax=Streptomyces sp. NPDC052052 TaxID=3154756 RepID=UPI00342800B7
MNRVVGVHGVGKQLMGSETLRSEWLPALSDGLLNAGEQDLSDGEFAMAFYGDLFRPPGRTLAVGDPLLTASDVMDGFELDLLLAWWQQAAQIDPAVPPATGSTTLARSPRVAQTALRALQRSRFFADVSLRALVLDLKQVRRYLLDPDLRTAARRRVQKRIGPETRVVVGHSLGSVVAYEALCAMPGHPVKALVTLGSPLGMRMVFDRLLPRPGAWPGTPDPGHPAPEPLHEPGSVGAFPHWTNVVDEGDIVASVKDLSLLFGPALDGRTVHNGSHAHDATAYLTAAETGSAVAEGLRHDRDTPRHD